MCAYEGKHWSLYERPVTLSLCSLFANTDVSGRRFCSTQSGKMISRVGGRPQPAECDGFTRQCGSGEAASGRIIGSHLSCCSNEIGGGCSGQVKSAFERVTVERMIAFSLVSHQKRFGANNLVRF